MNFGRLPVNWLYRLFMGRGFIAAVGVALLVAAAGCTRSGGAVTSDESVPSESQAPSSTAPSSTSSVAELPIGLGGEPEFLFRVPGAVSINVASNGVDSPAVVWITKSEVLSARLDVSADLLSGAEPVNGKYRPVAHPVERPAVAVGPGGVVHIAFTSGVSEGSVYSVSIEDGLAGSPVAISGDPRPETGLPAIATTADGQPVFVWLEDSSLSALAGENVGEVDDRTCECCNPTPIFVGDDLVIAYRDREFFDDRIARDISVVRSDDGGATYGTPHRIADDRWFLSGCPFTGPSAVNVGHSVVVAWMDARQTVHPDQRSSSIWVDRSDGEEELVFGTDLAVADGAIHRWPVMAVDSQDVIHMVWVTQGPDGGLSYSRSDDEGRSFQTHRILLSAEEYGPPTSPSVAHHEGLILVTWTANGEGFLAGWRATN